MKLTELALKASKKGAQRRFSANLSGPTHVIGKMLEAISNCHKQFGTDCWVIKVDGNLDGLSTIQAIRQGFFGIHSSPIITCYPVLKYGLSRYLGEDTLVRFLVLSGADIIYPGSRPRFDSDKAIDGAQLSEARRHYEKMRMGDYPLLSIAGGVSIGHVHSVMALMGTDIAFFVGGGFSLSKKGLKKAVVNFQKAIAYARDDLAKGNWDPDGLNQKYVPLTSVYSNDGVAPRGFEYVNPNQNSENGGRYAISTEEVMTSLLTDLAIQMKGSLSFLLGLGGMFSLAKSALIGLFGLPKLSAEDQATRPSLDVAVKSIYSELKVTTLLLGILFALACLLYFGSLNSIDPNLLASGSAKLTALQKWAVGTIAGISVIIVCLDVYVGVRRQRLSDLIKHS